MVLLLAFGIWKIVAAQAYTACNPLLGQCEPVQALGGFLATDFREGPSAAFHRGDTAGSIHYRDDDGVHLEIEVSGHNPGLVSTSYIMFGRVEAILKAAPGTGIISSVVLQSDDLDEIDLEWVGNDCDHVQTNWFSKGDTSSWDRGQFHVVASPQTEFHNYTIDWTAACIQWYVDGILVRTLRSSDTRSADYYPQTPMMVRVGAWAAGDPIKNPAGTVEWAGGTVDWRLAPFVMIVSELHVTDYSTGTHYRYADQSGSWRSIEALYGQVSADYRAPKSPGWLDNVFSIFKFRHKIRH